MSEIVYERGKDVGVASKYSDFVAYHLHSALQATECCLTLCFYMVAEFYCPDTRMWSPCNR